MTIPTTPAVAARRDLGVLFPAATVLAGWLIWVGLKGGYDPEVWYPSALVALSLWGIVVVAGGRLLPAARMARIALLLLLALAAINYLSILWADSPGSALQAANELALYLLVAWIFALLPWTRGALATIAGAWSAGVCAFCAVDLVRAADAPALTPFFIDARFSTPMQYSNATAALAVMGMWPALILASRREVPRWLRPLLLGCAAFLAAFATLPQSRAALFGLILTVPLALVAGSGRLRLLWRMLVVGGGLALCLPRTVSVNDAVSAGRDVTPVFSHAATGMLIAALGAIVLGAVLGLAEDWVSARARRRGARPRWSPGARRLATLGLAVVAVAAVAAGAVLAEPRISAEVHAVIQQGNTDAATGANRLLSASPEERFDYARVALHLFSSSPLLGVGSGNFGRHYDALRRFVKHSQYAHNLPLRVLSETGLLGAVVFVALVAALLIGMARAARGRDDLVRACAAIALCVSGYFIVHSCLDWVDQFPALAAPAIALPLAVIALAGAEPGAPSAPGAPAPGGADAGTEVSRPRRGRIARGLTAPVAATGAVFLMFALGAPYLSVRLVDSAFAVARSSPAQAYRDLSTAGSLNPLSATPITSEGTLALYLGDPARSERAFTRSLAKENAWYPRFELALIDAGQGAFGPALAQLRQVARLDANDPLVTEAEQMVTARHRINPLAFNSQILQEGVSTSAQQNLIR